MAGTHTVPVKRFLYRSSIPLYTCRYMIIRSLLGPKLLPTQSLINIIWYSQTGVNLITTTYRAKKHSMIWHQSSIAHAKSHSPLDDNIICNTSKINCSISDINE